MGVRNCRDIGENLQKIISRLMANDNLVNLLYYTDKDPLNHEILTDKQKKELVYEKLIKVIPRVGHKETATSVVVVQVVRGNQNSENSEFKNVYIRIEVFVPLTQWIIKNSNLRPFAILGEIQESLNNKFLDITNRWYRNDANILADLGYITGYQDNTFGGDKLITRAEVCKILNNVLGNSIEEKNKEIYKKELLDGFKDIKSDAWYFKEVLEALY